MPALAARTRRPWRRQRHSFSVAWSASGCARARVWGGGAAAGTALAQSVGVRVRAGRCVPARRPPWRLRPRSQPMHTPPPLPSPRRHPPVQRHRHCHHPVCRGAGSARQALWRYVCAARTSEPRCEPRARARSPPPPPPPPPLAGCRAGTRVRVSLLSLRLVAAVPGAQTADAGGAGTCT